MNEPGASFAKAMGWVTCVIPGDLMSHGPVKLTAGKAYRIEERLGAFYRIRNDAGIMCIYTRKRFCE